LEEGKEDISVRGMEWRRGEEEERNMPSSSML
jgi:hypothetical protein